MKYDFDGLAGFRTKVEEYFKSRKDVVERVIKCEVENYGNNVKLVTEVYIKRGWIFFFGDPETNYPDLEGVRTLRHACKDLSRCDRGLKKINKKKSLFLHSDGNNTKVDGKQSVLFKVHWIHQQVRRTKQ